MWRGVENRENSWKDCGQVLACINLIGLSNELYSSHLTIRLKMLEMGVQSALMALAESDQHTLAHQQNAAYILRLVYDLVVLDPNEDETKKCSLKLLDGVLTLLDALMVFQQYSLEEGWTEMVQICWGLLLKCMCNPQPEIVTTASSKFHSLLQKRQLIDQKEVSSLLFTLNKELQSAIELGNTEKYSFIGPVLKTLLDKTRSLLNLNTNTPDLPSTSAGPMFLHDFQMYCTSKQWVDFIEKKVSKIYFFQF